MLTSIATANIPLIKPDQAELLMPLNAGTPREKAKREASSLSGSMSFKYPQLLTPPVARAAYSDRTAWLMAEMSRFAYLKFESDAELLDDLAKKLAELKDCDRIKDELATFMKNSARVNGKEFAQLNTSLGDGSFQLVKTFNNGGTQAFIAERDSDKMAVLAFRGTETVPDDIKTDLNARFYTRDGVKVHDGFHQAFLQVESDVRKAVQSLPNHKLYITGHSLGGALALIATRALNMDNIAACYTFGSPRVGSLEFDSAIKVPIYRVVNAADAVPRVPPTWSIELIIFLARFIPIPYLRGGVVRILNNFVGYRHHGDMRYLTGCKEDFSDLTLISNPDLIDRARWMLQRLADDWRAGVCDHSIDLYCAKLEAYAFKRQ